MDILARKMDCFSELVLIILVAFILDPYNFVLSGFCKACFDAIIMT